MSEFKTPEKQEIEVLIEGLKTLHTYLLCASDYTQENKPQDASLFLSLADEKLSDFTAQFNQLKTPQSEAV